MREAIRIPLEITLTRSPQICELIYIIFLIDYINLNKLELINNCTKTLQYSLSNSIR